MSYWRFGAMIATSTVVMLGLMYLNTFVWAHVFWSETRVYMALLMGAVMAVIMLSFMWSMYSNKAVNLGIYAVAALVFALSLWLVRSQTTVNDVSYMRAMIPHHSIAILTSNRAGIDDPRVRKLADEIIAAQQKEISEMRYLVAVLEGETDVEVPPSLRAEEEGSMEGPVSVDRALAQPVTATLDAEDLTADEIATALPGPVTCRFLRTERSDPILATTGGANGSGIMKLSGRIVRLAPAPGPGDLLPGDGIVLQADGLTLEVVPEGPAGGETAGPRTADLRFALEEGLTVGYRGTWSCAD